MVSFFHPRLNFNGNDNYGLSDRALYASICYHAFLFMKSLSAGLGALAQGLGM